MAILPSKPRTVAVLGPVVSLAAAMTAGTATTLAPQIDTGYRAAKAERDHVPKDLPCHPSRDDGGRRERDSARSLPGDRTVPARQSGPRLLTQRALRARRGRPCRRAGALTRPGRDGEQCRPPL